MNNPSPSRTAVDAQGRAPQACDFCRMRKIKCDREKPTCSSCLNRNRQCLYSPTAAQQRRARKQLTNQRPTVPLPIMPQGSSIPPMAIRPHPVSSVMEEQTAQVFTHHKFSHGTSGPSSVVAQQGMVQSGPILGQLRSPGHVQSPVSAGHYSDSTLPSSPESQNSSQFARPGNDTYWKGLEGNPLIAQFMRTSLWDPPSSGPQYSESYPMALDGPTREIPTLERTPPSSDEMPLATLPSASLLSSEPPLSFAYPFQIASQHTSPTVEGQEMVPNHSAEISDGKPGGRSAIHDNLPLFKNSQPVSGETSSSVIPVNIKSVFPHSPTDRPFGKVSYGTRAESSIGDARHVSDKTAHWWHSFMMNTQKLPADDPSKVLFSRLTNAFFSKSVDLSSVPVSLPSDYSIIPRPLYLRSDLFFHSEVVLHLLNLFCRVFYPENQDLHYHRILVRHAQGFVDRSFLIAIMMTVTPMSSHEVFCDIPLRQASTHYHKRLVTMLPSVIESNSLDSVFVLGALSDYELGRGHTETSFYLSTTVIRKFQQWRVHIMDHPSPPPRLFADESVPDLPTSTDPLLRENYRNIWYSCIGRVVLSSLIFGHLPGVHNRDIYVNRQMPASQYLDLKDRSLADLHSPFYTDPKYPTFIMRPLNFHHNNPRFMNINAITHRVAELRYYRTTDPELWFRERTILNQKLEEWAQRKDIGNELSLVELQNMGKRFRYREYMIWRLHSLVWYYITLIFLNYPGEMNPWPFSPLEVIRQVEKRWNVDLDLEPAHPTSPPSPYPASPDSCSSNSEPPSNPLHELDPTGEVFMECGKLTWEGVKGLHRTIQRSLAVPNFFHNTLFVGALYAAGVVCILSVHTSKDPSTVGWARDFIEEIIDILSQVGELWVYNLDAARKLRQLLNVKSRRRYHITLTAQENLTNMV